MPRSPSAPSEPYLKCSSSFANTSFSSRKNFVQVKKAPSAIKITSTIAETQRRRFVLGCKLIVLKAPRSKNQTPNKFQVPNPKSNQSNTPLFGHLVLRFVWNLEFGVPRQRRVKM